MQILLVDDSRLVRRYVARTLEMTGIDDLCIHEAGNGREAMVEVRKSKPDLIITDLNMPEMNGEELIACVAQDPDLRGIPILVLSADRAEGKPEQLIHEGAIGYLTKPITPEDLRGRLLELVGSNV
ncbi:MAG TPA: response regulator [Bryobacteraceae bacterium]|jgi:two-component system chemotaxis response regulator CheY|nr:response regulator [Bryobacteraceae bacterium]